MSGTRRAKSGAVGGSSVDAGVEYQRSVAAYAVAHGLSGARLMGFGVSSAAADVTAVSLETDHPVDDIAVECGPWRVHIQARRRLRRGKWFETGVAQWVEAARSGLDPRRQRLVLVTGSASRPIDDVRKLLDRLRTDRPGSLTKAEQQAQQYLDSQLTSLSANEQRDLLRCAHIHVLDVEEVGSTGAREAVHLLERVVGLENALSAWHDVVRQAGEVARLRGGYDISRWLELLLECGYEIRTDEPTAAASLEHRRRALASFRAQVQARGSQVDLRPLGASVAPIPVDDLGMRPHVTAPGADDRDRRPLVWAVLRRGRAVLTGLPGGGKSTGLAIAAADALPLDSASLPVVVSLKDIDGGDRSRSFRDRLLDVAVRDLGSDERGLVRAELESRMGSGELLLFLDALDETRDRRGEVVHELDDFLRGVSEDVGVVLATRDVAYGQASTFGWENLRIAPPKETTSAVKAILERSAGAVDDAWAANRLRWVQGAIARDTTLRETPLLPILLALLAAEKDEDSLPEHRATILHAVVESVVRRESRRTPNFSVGDLAGDRASAAVLDGFAAEATQIAREGGRSPLAEVRRAVAVMLRSYWGLDGRPADATAESIVRFWDEAGFFVITGANETVSPRLELFAEVGEARHAVQQPNDDVTTWTETAARAGRYESLVLAAGLSPVAAEALVTTAVHADDRELLRTATTALRQGAELTPASLDQLTRALADDARTGDRQGWQSFAELLELPLDGEQIELAQDVLTSFPPDHEVVGRASLVLRFSAPSEYDAQTEVLTEVLRLESLSRLASRVPAGKPNLRDLAVDQQYVAAKIGAAERLLGVVEEAGPLVLNSLDHGSVDMAERLSELVESRGLTDLVDAIRQRERDRWSSMPKFLTDYDMDGHVRLLDALSEPPPADLTPGEAMRLDHLADLCETLDLNEVSAWPTTRPGDFDEFMAVVGLVETLGGFDPAVISAEARLARSRLDHSDDGSPFFALFDGATERELDRWDQLDDPTSAAQLFVQRLSSGLAAATVAAHALWGAPAADVAAPLIRADLPRLSSSTRHQTVAAHTLLSLTEAAELNEWLTDPDPILRTVAAAWVDISEAGALTDAARQILADDDAGVVDRLLGRLDGSMVPEVREALEQLVLAPPLGWLCRSCRTINESGGSSCTGCSVVGPKPASTAAELLGR